MPGPTRSDIHVNAPLTNILVAYMQAAENFIAHQVFPIVPVAKQSDRYFKYGKDDWFRDEAEVRAPGTESAGSGWDVDNTPNYYCDPYAIHKDVSEQDLQNQDNPIDLDRDSTAFVGQKILLRRERKWASQFFGTSIWGNTDQTGVSSGPGANQFVQWDQASSDPISIVKDRCLQIMSVTGYKPNVFIPSPRVWRVLEDHALIIDRIKYNGTPGAPAIVTPQAVAALFGVNKVLIPGAVVNTAAKGATAVVDFIFGKGALLAYANPAPSILMPSAGYTFLWTGLYGGEDGYRVTKWWEQRIKSYRIEGETGFDHKVVASDMGQFFDQCIA